MTKLKYKLLHHVHNSSVIHPATRMDFYKRKGKANQYKLAIDELIQRKYLSEEVSTGILTITSPGVDALEADRNAFFCSAGISSDTPSQPSLPSQLSL